MRIPSFDPSYGTAKPDYSGMYPYSFQVPDAPSWGSPLPQQAPQDPYNVDGLAQQEEAAKQAYFQSLMDTQVPYQPHEQSPGLSKQQGWIAGGLGLISAMSGPNGNAPGVVGNFVKQAMGRNTDKWQEAINAQKEQRQAEIDRKKLKAQMAQLDYEGIAREHGQAVTFKHQDTRDDIVTRRQHDLEKLKLQGDPQYQVSQLNAKLMSGEITREQWQLQVIPLIKNDPWAKAAYDQARAEYTKGPLSTKTTADAGLVKTKAEDIVATRAPRIKKILSSAGLDDKKAAFVSKQYSVFDEKTGVELALKRAQTEKALRPPVVPGEKPASVSSQRAAINSELAMVKAKIKEAQGAPNKTKDEDTGEVLGSGFGGAVSTALQLAPLERRKKELETALGLLNQSVSAPRGRMQGFVPLTPDPSQIAPERIKSAADALDQLGL